MTHQARQEGNAFCFLRAFDNLQPEPTFFSAPSPRRVVRLFKADGALVLLTSQQLVNTEQTARLAE